MYEPTRGTIQPITNLIKSSISGWFLTTAHYAECSSETVALMNNCSRGGPWGRLNADPTPGAGTLCLSKEKFSGKIDYSRSENITPHQGVRCHGAFELLGGPPRHLSRWTVRRNAVYIFKRADDLLALIAFKLDIIKWMGNKWIGVKLVTTGFLVADEKINEWKCGLWTIPLSRLYTICEIKVFFLFFFYSHGKWNEIILQLTKFIYFLAFRLVCYILW